MEITAQVLKESASYELARVRGVNFRANPSPDPERYPEPYPYPQLYPYPDPVLYPKPNPCVYK